MPRLFSAGCHLLHECLGPLGHFLDKTHPYAYQGRWLRRGRQNHIYAYPYINVPPLPHFGDWSYTDTCSYIYLETMSTIPSNKSECICRVIRDAARSLTNAYDKALAPSGLRTTQFTLLSVLARQSVATVTQLSELLELDQTTTTRNLSILEDAGLVMRVAHHDPRVKLMKLTPKGKQRRQSAVELWQEIQHDITSSLSEVEWQTFHKVLHTIESRCKERE